MVYGGGFSNGGGFSKGIGIPPELCQECVELFVTYDEFEYPKKLINFTDVFGLVYVRKCIAASDRFDYDDLMVKLVTTGRSYEEPALCDLLGALAVRYQEEEFKRKAFESLKARVSRALLEPENSEEEQVYQRLIQVRASGDVQGAKEAARRWIDEAGDDLDELALRITLAVFQGTTFDTIETAKNDLLKMLQEVAPTPAPETPPPAHIPLMRRLHKAGAFVTEGQPPDSEEVVRLKDLAAGEVIIHVWKFYREAEWRLSLMAWLTKYAAGHRADVRIRAAVAAGLIATKDYRLIRDNLLAAWVQIKSNRSQYRMAIGMALGVLVLEESWVAEVQGLLREWSRSTDPAERWAALRAYIYVGASCRPVKEVIEAWRDIAAFAVAATDRSVTIVVEDAEQKVVHLKPMLMSLIDAMMRFFVNVAQMSTEEKRPLLASILEGLEEWIADEKADAALGFFMFKTLGQLVTAADEKGEADGAPVLLQLVSEGSSEDEAAYRSQLAGLFEVLMRNGTTIMEARELLCAWLGWVDGVEDESRLYESRIRTLFAEITAADKGGRARGKLAACLRDCGRNRAAQRLLASL